MRPQGRSGPCIVYRPDAAGNLVPVGIQRPEPPKVRDGRFVVWDDLCQTTRHEGTLSECARAVLEHEDCIVMHWGRNGPSPLNPAERRLLRALMERDE